MLIRLGDYEEVAAVRGLAFEHGCSKVRGTTTDNTCGSLILVMNSMVLEYKSLGLLVQR
jgi:hypothetical protein